MTTSPAEPVPVRMLWSFLAVLFALPAAATPAAPAELGPKLTGWSYSTSALPLGPRWQDPGNRLDDGRIGRKAVSIWRGSDISFTLNLQGLCEVRGIRVYLYRHNLNYRLDRLEVRARQAGMWRLIAHHGGFLGPTPSMDFVFTLRFPPVKTGALRLDFLGCRVLSLAEIQVYGRRVGRERPGLGVYSGIPFRTGTGPIAREQDLDGDGVPEVVLENRLIRMVFTPDHGGVCRSLRCKPTGAELVYSGERGYGLFRDQFWSPRADFADRLYFHRIANSAGAGSVELWAAGSGGMMGFTEIRKRITLAAGSALIRVHYTLSNAASSQTDYTYGLWFHNWLGVPGAVNTYYYPTVTGVQTLTLDPATVNRGRDVWQREPARGWTAVLAATGTGLAVEIPYRYLNLLYSWYGPGAPAATLEWRFNRIRVPAGGRLEADFTLFPFRSLDHVDGVAGDTAGAVDARVDARGRLETSIRLFSPAGAAAGTARIGLRVQASGRTRPLGSVPLRPGGVSRFQANVTLPKPGAYAVTVTVWKNGKAAGEFERPVFFGGARFAYRLAPECAQVGEKEEAAPAGNAPEHGISTAVVTPHIPWAVPFAGGRIEALVLMDDMNCREAVELAERLDMHLDYVKFRTTFAKELRYQGDQSILTLEAAQRHLLQHLRRRRYDVMVFAGFKWDFHFTPEIRRAVFEQVRRGAGLVLIQPDGFTPAMAKILPAAGVAKAGNAGRRMNAWFRWRPAPGSNPLVQGLDWSRFPLTRRQEYRIPPKGRVIATIGKGRAPLLVLSKLGRGRVVTATWDTLTHALSYRGYSALTPILSYRGGWLRPEFAHLPRNYQEWWFALLARLTAWAAGRDTGVSIAAAPPITADLTNRSQTPVRITIFSRKARAGCSVETYWFNAAGDAAARTTVGLSLKPGNTRIALALPEGLDHGADTACFIVRDPGGAALAWGFTTVHGTTPVWVRKLELTPDTLLPAGGVWQADSPVASRVFTPAGPVRARLEFSAPAPANTRVEWRLEDTYGRRLLEAADPVPAGASQVVRRFPVFPLVAQGIECTALLRRAGGEVWDVRHGRIVAYRPRVWNRFWLTSWGGQYLWRSHYLFDFNNRLVRDFGVDVSFWGDMELHTGKVRDNAYWGINHSWLGLLHYLGRGVPDFEDRDYAKKAAAYARTHAVKFLRRTPCLVDPEWRAAVARKLTERVRSTLGEGGAVDYCMGDEMSLTYYTRFFDYDWSPASLADFRKMLEKKYSTLGALNRAWNTDFRSWNAVMPMTREQARKAANPAPWFEFRLYMNRQLADFFAFVQKTIRRVDPHARCGLSGTQSPEAANGMDWWLLSHAFSYFHSYNTNWSCEMRRSFQAHGGADQSPYFAGYSVTDPGAEHRMWWCLFHDTRGISAWKTALFFYGDFTETRCGRDTRRHLEAFRRGIWRLLRHAKRQQDGIAIYFSMPSITAGALDGDERRINAARDAWVRILEDSGFQYDFVAGPQVAGGILVQGGYRVLVLPWTTALPRAQVRAVRAFVRRGGVLIATRLPAVRDGLGRPCRPAQLADVFGVRRSASPSAVDSAVRLARETAGLPAGFVLRLPPLSGALAVQAGARPLGFGRAGKRPVPVLVLGPREQTLLLNLDLTHYDRERHDHSPAERGLRRILAAFLARAGLRPRYPLRVNDKRPPHIEVIRYRDGALRYLCLLQNDAEAAVADIALGGQWVVYDARAERLRGRHDHLRVPIGPLAARVFCLSPRPLARPVLTAPNSVVRSSQGPDGAVVGGRIPFRVRLEGNPPGPELVRVTVRDARGRERSEFMQTVWGDTRDRPSFVPLALDAPLGEWTLKATVVGAGLTAGATVQVGR